MTVFKKMKKSVDSAGRRNDDPQPLSKPKQPTLTVNNTPIRFKRPLEFSFSGFQPKEPVYVYCDGKGVNTSWADGQGSGSAYFVGNDKPGDHVLEARDSFGKSAKATFAVEEEE